MDIKGPEMHALGTVCPQSESSVSESPHTGLHGWLRMLLRWGLPRFAAYNCLPLHRCRFSKYDSLILMCLGKHIPNTNAALHAWAHRCRCRLIITPTCTPSWSVIRGTIPIFALSRPRPPMCTSLWLISLKPVPLSRSQHFHWAPLHTPRKITFVQFLMEIFGLGLFWLRVWGERSCYILI